MKNLRWIIGVLIVVGLVIPGHSLVFKRDQSVEIAPDEVVEDDLIAFAGNVDIKGTVLGDVYAFAQSVTITGDVGGSVFAGGACYDRCARCKDNLGFWWKRQGDG